MIRITRILVALAALCAASAHAVDICITSTGTATSGTCAGATCTTEEWGNNAVCYPGTTAVGYENALIAAATAGGGTTITLDDQQFAVSNSAINAAGMSASGGAITIRCRTATRGACGIISGLTNEAVWDMDDGTDANDFVFQNIACSHSAPITSTFAAGCIRATGTAVGDVTLDSVYFHDIDFAWSGQTLSSSGGVVIHGSTSNSTLYVMGDSLIENITVAANTVAGGIIRMASVGDLNISGLTIQNITTESVDTLILCNDTCTIANLIIDGWTNVEVTADESTAAITHADTSLTLSVTDSVMRNSTLTGQSPRAGFIDTVGPTTIARVTCDNVTVNASANNDPSAVCLFGGGDAAVITASDLTVADSVGQYGGLFYVSQGASITLDRGYIHDSSLRLGILGYCGGWGDCTIRNTLAVGNEQLTGGETIYGSVWYCQAHTTTTRDRACSLYHSVAVGNSLLSDNVGSVLFRNQVTNDTACSSSTCDMTMNIQNSVIRNGETQEIYTDMADADTTNTLNIYGSNLTNSADPTTASAAAGSTTENFVSLQSADPRFLNANGTTAESFKTRSGSPLRRAGIPISPNYTLRDYRNCRFDIPPTIGAFEVCAGDAP